MKAQNAYILVNAALKGAKIDIDDLVDVSYGRVTKRELFAMRRFLRFAIKNGFTEEVEFKYGRRGRMSGMWAYDGMRCLYRTFMPSDNYWDYMDEGLHWVSSCFPPQETERQVLRFL